MKKLALLFPGQGAQHPGMGKEMCQYFPAADKTFEEANDILHMDFKRLCFEGDLKELTKTENAQPALLTIGIAKYRVYQQELGITPAIAAGHSLGEFSALACARSISFPDALRLVRLRGQFMQEASEGSMSAVSGVPIETIETVCARFTEENQVVVIANYNSPDQVVISGHKRALGVAGEQLAAKDAHVVPLNVSAAFHSPLMKEAADKFAVELYKFSFKMPDWPVISNVTALPYENEESIPQLLKQQITSPIRWQESMIYLKEQGIDTAIELGPKKVLRNLMRRNDIPIKVYSTNTQEDLNELYEVDPDDYIDERPTFLEQCLAAAVCTPNRNFNEEEYRKGVIEPYRKLQDMYYRLAEEKREPDTGHMEEVVTLLRRIFKTKKLPVREQKKREKILLKSLNIN